MIHGQSCPMQWTRFMYLPSPANQSRNARGTPAASVIRFAPVVYESCRPSAIITKAKPSGEPESKTFSCLFLKYLNTSGIGEGLNSIVEVAFEWDYAPIQA